MEDKEYDLCNKKLNNLLKRDKTGKLVLADIIRDLEWIFRSGYKLGKEQTSKKEKENDK
jgi:hypothetical protein